VIDDGHLTVSGLIAPRAVYQGLIAGVSRSKIKLRARWRGSCSDQKNDADARPSVIGRYLCKQKKIKVRGTGRQFFTLVRADGPSTISSVAVVFSGPERK